VANEHFYLKIHKITIITVDGGSVTDSRFNSLTWRKM